MKTAKAENNSKKTVAFWYTELAVLMIALGSSDAARGVFATVFQDHFSLDASGISLLITISYVGNLVFMLIGSRLSDSLGLYRVFPISILMMGIAYFMCALFDSYPLLLISIFFTMGASTLLNTLMNVMSSDKFRSPGMIINTLFFIQGIGTTITQSVIGGSVSLFHHWRIFCLVILLILVLSFISFIVLDHSTARNSRNSSASTADVDTSSGSAQTNDNIMCNSSIFRQTAIVKSYQIIVTSRSFWMLFFIFGFYFVAEHGIMNWMNIYAQADLKMAASTAALLPSIFFGGITIGRLLLAPLVNRLGIMNSLRIFMLLGTTCYVLAFLLGSIGSSRGFMFLLPAGLFLSIVYPTLTMAIRLYFKSDIKTTATGFVMSCATAFDILFNAFFGRFISSFGYTSSMRILPVSLMICCLLFLILPKPQTEK